ncbi:MAG: peptidoglycan-binding protein [Clostridia bacterium]|nr:peptidoglycan-binding protein [Clostridia bacterium]
MSAESTRLAIRNKYREIIGRNNYNDSSRRTYCYKKYSDGKYYSDCSSSVSCTYQEVGVGFGIMRTTGMWESTKFEDVPVVIKDGVIQNPGVLRIGDMLLFAGTHSSRKAWGYVGHVEMVGEISGSTVTLYGHGSAHPKKREMNAYCRTRYKTKTSKTPVGNCGLLRVRRYIRDDAPDPSLRKGDKGGAVRVMQEKLLQQGYYLPKYGADGDFGSETFAALRQFQADHGLPVTGVYDAATKKVLEAGLPGARWVVSTGNSVNVRTAPNTSGKKLGKVNKGDKLIYQGVISDEGWYLVIYEGQNAWICGKYAEVVME